MVSQPLLPGNPLHDYTKRKIVLYGASGVVVGFLQLIISGVTVYKETEHCSQLSFP